MALSRLSPFFQLPARMQQAGVSALAAVRHRSTETERVPAYSVHMDAMRAAAAFVVLTCHARLMLFGEHRSFAAGASGAKAAPPPLGLGHHAVIIFFVLSGFLVGNSIWRAVRSGRWSWSQYLLQRMTRLWIVLLPALAIGNCLDRVGLHYLADGRCLYGMLADDLPARLTYKVLLANSLFLQTIRAPSYGTNAALWSLANEFWYYMAFPLLLLAIVGRGAWRRLAYTGALVLLLAFVGSGIAALFAIWLLGFVVSVLPLTLASRYQRAALVLCLVQFGAANVLVKRGHLPYLAADLLLGVSFALLLYAVAHRRQLTGSFLYQRTVTRLSSFSYTLYLTHLPFLTLLIGLLLRPWHPWAMDPLHLLFAGLVVAATYIYAYGLYLAFERHTPRVRKLLSRPTLGRVGARQPV